MWSTTGTLSPRISSTAAAPKQTTAGLEASQRAPGWSSIMLSRAAMPSTSRGRKARSPDAAATPTPASSASQGLESMKRSPGPLEGPFVCRTRTPWLFYGASSGPAGECAVPMPVSTWVEVDLDRFAANLHAVRSLLRPEQEILLVIKADAYGHGAVEIAEAAEREGVAQLGVATLHEGIQLRRAGCRLPIVVLSPLLPSEIEEAVA